MTILGAGATARSSLVSAAELGAEQVSGRCPYAEPRPSPLRALGERLGVAVEVQAWDARLPEADLVISTATAGAADAIAAEVAASAPVSSSTRSTIRGPRRWRRRPSATGSTVLNGLDLLVGQALLQLELMTGHQVSPDVLYAAGRAELMKD